MLFFTFLSLGCSIGSLEFYRLAAQKVRQRDECSATSSKLMCPIHSKWQLNCRIHLSSTNTQDATGGIIENDTRHRLREWWKSGTVHCVEEAQTMEERYSLEKRAVDTSYEYRSESKSTDIGA